MSLLHSSCHSRRQWRALTAELAGQYRVLALDLIGYGDTVSPQDPQRFTLGDEVALVERLLARVVGRVHLVGHSYGGAVALAVALRHRDRIQSLFLHEPVVFQLARSEGLTEVSVEIDALATRLAERVARGDLSAAARYFIDYWRGAGTWAELPDKRKQEAARVIAKVPLEFLAIFGAPERLPDYASLRVPTRLTSGDTGPSAARKIARLLAPALGGQCLHVVEGVGHMAPITDPHLINPHIVSHLAANPVSRGH